MIRKEDCINFEVLNTFPIIDIPKKDLPLQPVTFSPSLPPDYPLYWAEIYPNGNFVVMKDQKGDYRVIEDPMSAWELRKRLPLDHPAVQAFIQRTKEENAGSFIHPEHGIFRLDFFDHDLLEYKATDKDDPEKVLTPPTKEELEPFATEEHAYYPQLIRRYYPDYQP